MLKIAGHFLIVFLILLAGFQYSKIGSGSGESFPQRPVRVVVPFNPGGGTDTYARILQKAIKDNDLMPQPLVIVNKPGGGATIGSNYVKDARNDGYTLLCLHEALMTSKATGQSTFGAEAFEAVAATGEMGQVVLVANESRFATMNDLMETAKAEPETLKFGVNLGTPTHFSGIQLENTLPGARFRLVTTGGGANRLAALMGGHLDAAIFSVGELIRFRDNGLRALAYLGENRLDAIPEIPTAKELGYPVYSSNLQYWWLPKGTDPEIIDYMASVLKRAMETDYVLERSKELEILPRTILGDELAERIESKTKLFSLMKTEQRVDLPDVTVWTIVAICVFGAMVLGKIVFGKRTISENAKEGRMRYDLAFGTLGMCLVYVLLMGLGVLPFVWATIAFIVASGLYLTSCDRRKLVYVFEVAFTMSFGLHYIFTVLFTIQLP